MPKIYRVHAQINGDSAMKGSHPNIADALREAKFLLGNGASAVWIDDRNGHPILPADQVMVRVAELAAASPSLGRSYQRRGAAI